MFFARHIFIAFSYSVVAAAVALALPSGIPSVGTDVAIAVGATLLVGCALLHEVFARQEEEQKLADEMFALRRAQAEVMQELAIARRGARGIQDSPEAAAARRTNAPSESDFDNVVAEVRVLQRLVDQLSRKSGTRFSIEQGHEFPGDLDAPSHDLPDPELASDDPATVTGTALVPAGDSLNDLAILDIVCDGLRDDKVDLFLQPIVSMPQRKRKFFEALTRIRAGDDSIIVPEQYIAIAEREGLIGAIDNMLLFLCVQHVRQAQRRSQNVCFFCNISPHSLDDENFFNEFIAFMSENGVLAPNLVFEFSQATVADHDEQLEHYIRRLAFFGFRFSMDQVTSLNFDYTDLAARHFRFVKIEALTLLVHMDEDGENPHIAKLKGLLERDGIDLIVEKIESEPMLLDLLDCHIDFS